MLALLQLLLELRRKETTILWYGELRDVPLPAAVACNSPWLDITQSSPSWELDNPSPYDYLPKPELVAKANIKDCDIWPATPPRKNLYVDDDLVTHPLASVVMSRSWKGSPPVYMCTGWEILAFENKFLAKKLESEGVTVVFEEYEAMPHDFVMILDWTANSQRCYESWAAFMRAAVEDAAGIRSKAVSVTARTLDEVPLEFEQLSDVTDEQVRQRVLAKASADNVQDVSSKL